jgi:hypothetical protein
VNKVTWYYGTAIHQVIIVQHVIGNTPFFFPRPKKPPHNETDYMYSTVNYSLTVHASNLDFSACYECEAINSKAEKQHYQSYTPQLLGKELVFTYFTAIVILYLSEIKQINLS